MEKRLERVQGCFVGNMNGVGSASVLFFQLKSSKTGDFGRFLLKMSDFSRFW